MEREEWRDAAQPHQERRLRGRERLQQQCRNHREDRGMGHLSHRPIQHGAEHLERGTFQRGRPEQPRALHQPILLGRRLGRRRDLADCRRRTQRDLCLLRTRQGRHPEERRAAGHHSHPRPPERRQQGQHEGDERELSDLCHRLRDAGQHKADTCLLQPRTCGMGRWRQLATRRRCQADGHEPYSHATSRLREPWCRHRLFRRRCHGCLCTGFRHHLDVC